MRALIVTAVAAEAEAVSAALGAADDEVVVAGVGPAAAAAATAWALARGGHDLVVCAGIGGGLPPMSIGDLAVASSIVFADLGAETADGFVPASQLGFGTTHYDVPAALAVALADRTGGHLGGIATVATVTGSRAGADALVAAFPDVVAEGMEGAGVAAAAAVAGLPAIELRAISNAVGPRDRAAWRIDEALRRLGRAVADARGAGWDA